MQGLNISQTVALAEAVSIPVIASGGLASIEDVKRLLEPDCARLAGGRLPGARSMTAGSTRARRWR